MRTRLRAYARFESLVAALRQGFLRLIFGKNWACARYQRRRVPLAGPRPGARLN